MGLILDHIYLCYKSESKFLEASIFKDLSAFFSGPFEMKGSVCLFLYIGVLVQCVLFNAEWCIKLLALVFFYHTL